MKLVAEFKDHRCCFLHVLSLALRKESVFTVSLNWLLQISVDHKLIVALNINSILFLMWWVGIFMGHSLPTPHFWVFFFLVSRY